MSSPKLLVPRGWSLSRSGVALAGSRIDLVRSSDSPRGSSGAKIAASTSTTSQAVHNHPSRSNPGPNRARPSSLAPAYQTPKPTRTTRSWIHPLSRIASTATRAMATPSTKSTAPRHALGCRRRTTTSASGWTEAISTSAVAAVTTGRSTISDMGPPDPWVEVAVRDVDERVDDDVDHRDHEHRSLDHDEVAVVGGSDDQAAHPGQREEVLDDDRRADQPAEADAHQGDERERRRTERIAEEDVHGPHPLRLGGEDVVLVEGADQVVAQDPREHRGLGERDRQRGQERVVEVLADPLAEARPLRPGEPPELVGEDHDDEESGEEARHRQDAERAGADHPVQAPTGAVGGDHGERHGDGQGHRHAEHGELDAHRQRGHDPVRDVDVRRDDGRAEVAR